MAPTSPVIDIRSAAAFPKAAGRILEMYELALVPCRLTATQFVILGEIYARRARPLVFDELATSLQLDRPRLRWSLRALERARLVRFAPPGEGQDGWRMELTAEGLARFRQARPLWKRAQAQLDDTLGKPLATDLRDMLALLAALDLAGSLNLKTSLYDHAAH